MMPICPGGAFNYYVRPLKVGGGGGRGGGRGAGGRGEEGVHQNTNVCEQGEGVSHSANVCI